MLYIKLSLLLSAYERGGAEGWMGLTDDAFAKVKKDFMI